MDEEKLIADLEKVLGKQNKDINLLIAEFKRLVRNDKLSSSQISKVISDFEKLNKLEKKVTDQQLKDLQAFTKSIDQGRKILNDFNKTTEKITGTIFSLGDAGVTGAEKIGFYTRSLEGLPIFGQAIADLGDSLDFNIENFRSLASVGADFGQSLIALRITARDALLPLQEFTDFVGQETQILAGLFGSVNQGTSAVAALARGVRQDLIPQFAGLGITTENYLDFLGTFLELQRVQGRTQFQSQEQTTAALSNYTLVLDAVTKLTGTQRDQLNEAVRRQGADAKFQLFLQTLDNDRAVRLQTFIAGLDSINPALGDATKNILATGFPLGEFEQKLVALGGDFLQNTLALREGTMDIGAFAQGLSESAGLFRKNLSPAVLATDAVIGEVGNSLIGFNRRFASLDEITRQQLVAGDGLTSQIGVTQESFRQFKAQIEGLQTNFLQSFGPGFANVLGVTGDGLKSLGTAIEKMGQDSPAITGAAVASALALKYTINYAKEIGIVAAGVKLGNVQLNNRLGSIAGKVGKGAARAGVGGLGAVGVLAGGELAESSDTLLGRGLGVGSAALSGAMLGSVIPGIGTTVGAVLGGLYGLTRAIDLPERQFGGPLSANNMALVGERGPELFLPSTSGNVVPLTTAMMQGNTTVSGSVDAKTAQADMQIGQVANSLMKFSEASEKMEKHLNTLVKINAKTEQNTGNANRKLANLKVDLV
tara:strand:+ start:2485 stop:4611 length:2127 start_codon:yes stop_codon:yes gene_type:complete